MNTERLGDEHRAEKDHEVHRQHGCNMGHHLHTRAIYQAVLPAPREWFFVSFCCCLFLLLFVGDFFFLNVSPSMKEKSTKSTFSLSAQQNELPHRERQAQNIYHMSKFH